MAKKKELVENFQQIIDSGDLEAFKKVFDTCEISATRAPVRMGKTMWKTTCNAFTYKNLTPAHLQFLVDNGLEVNGDCGYGYPAITFQASNIENLKCLLDNGADIEFASPKWGTALAIACMAQNSDAVRNLIDAGASIKAKGADGEDLLDIALSHSDENHVIQSLSIAKVLLEHGAKTTKWTKNNVERVGSFFKFKKAEMNNEQRDELTPVMDELYSLVGIAPVVVTPKKIHDGVSEIKVSGKNWNEKFNELWELLVPSDGKAQTIQGEAIRIIGKVTYELLDNGGMNWDADYRKMKKFLAELLRSNGGALEKEKLDEAVLLAGSISSKSDEKTLYKLTELIVDWVLANPKPILLGEVDYKR